MNVVHVIAGPFGGGAEFVAKSIHNCLRERGIRSSIIYLSKPSDYVLEEGEYSLNSNSLKNPLIVLRLRKLMKSITRGSGGNTVIHGHLTQALYYVPFATFGLGLKKIFTEHSTHNWRRRIWLLRPLERFIYSTYDKITCISLGVFNALSKWLARPGGSGLTIVNNGARQFHFPERVRSDKLYVLSIGSLNFHKGFDTAIDAISSLKSIVGRYSILGEGPERSSLVRRINDLNAQDIIQLEGWSDDISEALRSANLMIVPSRWEGFGLVAIEGLSSGLPVICSDVDGLRDVLEGCEAAFLFAPGDPEALADTIRGVHARMTLGEDFTSSAQAHAAKYSIDTMVDLYIRVYTEVLHSKKGS